MQSKDEIVASGKWVFDDNVCDCFDDMLSRSIPNYTAMRTLTFNIGKRFITPHGSVLDVGCSNGKSLEQFAQYADALNNIYRDTHNIRIYGVDISEPFVTESKKRFANRECVTIEHRDIVNDFPKGEYDLILSTLTVQFTPIEHRQRLFRNMYKSLKTGGALILTEKLIGECYEMDDMFTELYYDMKHQNGYTHEQIQAKRKSLEGVLVPITEDWNKALMRQAGFSRIDCFWRCYNFAGFVAVKE